MDKGDIIGLIPFKPDDTFKFMTYYLKDLLGIFEPYIYECISYPFCIIDSSSFNKSIPLRNISGSYSISYTKNEYGNISPIGKIQKILLIKTILDGYLEPVSMYTNENKIKLSPFIKYNNYLRKNNYDNLLMPDFSHVRKLFDEFYNYLSLEIISGDASISFETPNLSLLEVIKNKNKYSYIFRTFQKSNSLLKIKANKNTAYSIILDIELENNDKKNYKENYKFQIGNNFLYELKDNFREYNLNFINSITNFEYNNSYSYFKFFPINCQIEIKNLDSLGKLENNQELIPHSKQKYNYNVKRVDNKNESCQFYVSTYSIELNRTFNKMESATISKNIPHYSIFNKEIKKIKYFYPHTEIENNLMVNFTIKNEAKDNYIFSVYINEFHIHYITYQRENSFTFNSSDIAKRCKDEKQICSIYFVLEANSKDESTVEFIITPLDSTIKQETNNSNFLKKNLVIILIILGDVILLLIIIFLIVYLCKRKNKSDLSTKVNQISFEEDREKRSNEEDESLLS